MGPIEIIFETFYQAMNIHTKLFNMLRETGFVTYADLLYMVQNNSGAVYPDNYYKHGWTNLFYAKVEPNYDGKWILKMPITKILKEKKIKI